MRLSDRIVTWVEGAIDAHALGDDVTWDVTVVMANTPNGQQPAVVVPMWMASPVVGQWIVHTIGITDPQATTGATIERLVREAFEALRATRSRILAGTNGGPKG